jgi:hypothetical protein
VTYARRKSGGKSQDPSSKSQGNLKLQILNQSGFDRLGFGWLKLVWDLVFGIWDFGRATSAVS